MTCKGCVHYEVCGGFTPTDLDTDVFDYCREGRSDEIPNIEERCPNFKPKSSFVEVVRCKDCKNWDKDTKIKAPYCAEEGKPIDMTMVDYAECEKMELLVNSQIYKIQRFL